MNSLEIVDLFAASIERKEEPTFVIDRENAEKEILKEKQAYSGLGIKILSICGGLLGTFFFLGFIAMSIMDSSVATFIFGSIVLTGAILLDKKPNNTVLDTICIGAFLSGCILLGYSVNKMADSDNLTIFILMLITIITVVATENYMLNFFAVLIFNSCLFAFIETNNANILIHILTIFISIGFVAINFLEYQALIKSVTTKRYAPFRLGFLVSLSVLLIYFSINSLQSCFPYRWISSVIIILAALYSIGAIFGFLKLKSGYFITYAFAIAILATVIFAPSICGAILILIIGIHVGHRLTIVFGIAGLVYFVGQFYYDLQYTLLTKSIMMFCTGILLLTAGYIFNKQFKIK